MPSRPAGDLALCLTCAVRHPCAPGSDEGAEFLARHRGHRALVLPAALLVPEPAGWRGNANIKEAFGANNQALSCTITSLANNGQRGSAAVDNSANLYTDALVFVKTKTNAAGTSSTGTVNVYAYGTADGGTTYSDGLAGTDSAATLTNPPNVPLIGVLNAVANATTYFAGPFSVAKAFGGTLPDHWGVVIENKSGGALDASVGSLWYQGVYATVG